MGDAAGSRTTRAFLCFEIPDPVRAAVERLQRDWRGRFPSSRWVRVASQHLTAKFLGDCTDEMLKCLGDQLRGRLTGHDGVRFELAGTGFFPNPRRPRVAWIGGTAAAVEPVIEAVEKAAARCGFEASRKPWTLHLTQARLKQPWPRSAVAAFLRAGESLRLEPFVCSELVLMASELQPGGAVYTALERIRLS
jgi:2'-5' RNA ligase